MISPVSATGLVMLGLAQSPRLNDADALRLCALLALTAKGVSEGWETNKPYTSRELHEVYDRAYGTVDDERWQAIISAVRSVPVFESAFSFAMSTVYFFPSVSRDMACLMLDYCVNAKTHLQHTLSEAARRLPAGRLPSR